MTPVFTVQHPLSATARSVGQNHHTISRAVGPSHPPAARGSSPTAAPHWDQSYSTAATWVTLATADTALYQALYRGAILQVLLCFPSQQLPQTLTALVSSTTEQYSGLFYPCPSYQPCSLLP